MKDNKTLKNRIKATVIKWLKVIFNPRLLLCLGIAWMITNGWCYIFTVVGTLCDISWMTIAGGAYMSLLWVPFTPEKVLTLIIAIFLLRLFFPKDEKTLGTLREEMNVLKATLRKKREQRIIKRNKKRMIKQ